jgi:hypothetical protein
VENSNKDPHNHNIMIPFKQIYKIPLMDNMSMTKIIMGRMEVVAKKETLIKAEVEIIKDQISNSTSMTACLLPSMIKTD